MSEEEFLTRKDALNEQHRRNHAALRAEYERAKSMPVSESYRFVPRGDFEENWKHAQMQTYRLFKRLSKERTLDDMKVVKITLEVTRRFG